MFSAQEISMCKKFDSKIAVRKARIIELELMLSKEVCKQKVFEIKSHIEDIESNINSFELLRSKFNCDEGKCNE